MPCSDTRAHRNARRGGPALPGAGAGAGVAVGDGSHRVGLHAFGATRPRPVWARGGVGAWCGRRGGLVAPRAPVRCAAGVSPAG
eukprot:6787099-Prymnesium_polylepis.2